MPDNYYICKEKLIERERERKKKLYTELTAFQKPLSLSYTHKHIGTNTYTSKQRCHFTQEGSAVLSIRQGLVLGQRLLPNLRPPSPGSTGPLWPPSGPHHPGDKLPIVPALLINDSSPVQTNFRAHSKHTHPHTHKLSVNGALYERIFHSLIFLMELIKRLSDTNDGRVFSCDLSFVPRRPDEVMLRAHSLQKQGVIINA